MIPKRMKNPPAKAAESLPPISPPSRVIIMRTWTDDDGSTEKTIDLVEPLRPGLVRTYRETRRTGPKELPRP